jgi:hypothetical protein
MGSLGSWAWSDVTPQLPRSGCVLGIHDSPLTLPLIPVAYERRVRLMLLVGFSRTRSQQHVQWAADSAAAS